MEDNMNTKFNLKELIESGLIKDNHYMRVTGICYDEYPYEAILFPENKDCLYFKSADDTVVDSKIATMHPRFRSIIAGDMLDTTTYAKYKECQVVEIKAGIFRDIMPDINPDIHPVIDIFIDVTEMFIPKAPNASNEKS